MTSLNSPASVSINLYQNFVYVAVKSHVYLRQLGHCGIAVRPKVLLGILDEAIQFVESTLKGITDAQLPITWLFYSAFYEVFSAKPTAYHGEVLEFLATASRQEPDRPWLIAFDDVVRSGESIRAQVLH